MAVTAAKAIRVRRHHQCRPRNRRDFRLGPVLQQIIGLYDPSHGHPNHRLTVTVTVTVSVPLP